MSESETKTKTESHEAVVNAQFGARANSYLTSAVHAKGADLDALAILARQHPEAATLDLGCGGGHVTFAVAPHVRNVVAYDLSPEMLAVVAGAAADRGLANVSTRQGVVERLPFADAGFDLVLSRYSAHHWRDHDAALREAARVLKPGGAAAFVDVVAPPASLLDTYFQAIELLRDCSHVRDYSRAEWEAALARAGFLPCAVTQSRVRLDFAAWVERMRTPDLHVAAIRALQAAVSADVTRYFDTEPDGSFFIDVAVFQVAKPI
jgi:ubiquinone/menaquinone biosynthesis C-methylase UbiE